MRLWYLALLAALVGSAIAQNSPDADVSGDASTEDSYTIKSPAVSTDDDDNDELDSPEVTDEFRRYREESDEEEEKEDSEASDPNIEEVKIPQDNSDADQTVGNTEANADDEEEQDQDDEENEKNGDALHERIEQGMADANGEDDDEPESATEGAPAQKDDVDEKPAQEGSIADEAAQSFDEEVAPAEPERTEVSTNDEEEKEEENGDDQQSSQQGEPQDDYDDELNSEEVGNEFKHYHERSSEERNEDDDDREKPDSGSAAVTPGEDDDEQKTDGEDVAQKGEEEEEEEEKDSKKPAELDNSEEIEEEEELEDKSDEKKEDASTPKLSDSEEIEEEEELEDKSEEKDDPKPAPTLDNSEEIEEEEELEDSSVEKKEEKKKNALDSSEELEPEASMEDFDDPVEPKPTPKLDSSEEIEEEPEKNDNFLDGSEELEPEEELEDVSDEKPDPLDAAIEAVGNSEVVDDVTTSAPIHEGSTDNVERELGVEAAGGLKEEIESGETVVIPDPNPELTAADPKKTVHEKIVEQAEKAFDELMKREKQGKEKGVIHQGTTDNVQQAMADEAEADFIKGAVESSTVEPISGEEKEEDAEEKLVEVADKISHVEIRAAIIKKAERAFKQAIRAEETKDVQDELRAEPKVPAAEKKVIKKLLKKKLAKKEAAAIERAEKAEEKSIIITIGKQTVKRRLRREALERAEDPTTQPDGAEPIELPIDIKDTTGKNETLPVAIVKDTPLNETTHEDLATKKFTDKNGWIHYPWKKFPLFKKRKEKRTDCGCEIMWIKKVYKRRGHKSLLLVGSSHIKYHQLDMPHHHHHAKHPRRHSHGKLHKLPRLPKLPRIGRHHHRHVKVHNPIVSHHRPCHGGKRRRAHNGLESMSLGELERSILKGTRRHKSHDHELERALAEMARRKRHINHNEDKVEEQKEKKEVKKESKKATKLISKRKRARSVIKRPVQKTKNHLKTRSDKKKTKKRHTKRND